MEMKSLAAPLAVCFLSLAFASGSPPQLQLPAFDPSSLAPASSETAVAGATLPQLRTQLLSNNYAVQDEAAKALIAAGDAATISRLVYAMKQGNDVAQSLLRATPSVKMLPYLLEEVAHGSLQPHVGKDFERVRVAATEITVQALAGMSGLPEETSQWLQSLAHAGGHAYFLVPEKSKAVLDWWAHNGEAVQSGNNAKAGWLPAERELSPLTFHQWSERSSAKTPPPPPARPKVDDPFYLPLPVAEPYEAWAARVSDFKKLDLTYAKVDFETGNSVIPQPGASKSAAAAPSNDGEPQKHTASPQAPSPPQTVAPASAPWFTWLLLAASAVGLWLFALKARARGH